MSDTGVNEESLRAWRQLLERDIKEKFLDFRLGRGNIYTIIKNAKDIGLRETVLDLSYELMFMEPEITTLYKTKTLGKHQIKLPRSFQKQEAYFIFHLNDRELRLEMQNFTGCKYKWADREGRKKSDVKPLFYADILSDSADAPASYREFPNNRAFNDCALNAAMELISPKLKAAQISYAGPMVGIERKESDGSVSLRDDYSYFIRYRLRF